MGSDLFRVAVELSEDELQDSVYAFLTGKSLRWVADRLRENFEIMVRPLPLDRRSSQAFSSRRLRTEGDFRLQAFRELGEARGIV